MKALILCMLLSFSLRAMDFEKTLEQKNEDQVTLEAAGTLKVNGPDFVWHKANSLIQAIIWPQNVTYSSNGIRFFHYKRPYIMYDATYERVAEWLSLICEKDYKEVARRADEVIKQDNPLARLTEFQKFLLAKQWLYSFLEPVDSPTFLIKNDYINALKAGAFEQLSLFAKSVAQENAGTLIDHINQRKKEILT